MGNGPSLFDAAAERAALASGRSKSQERAEILAPEPILPGVAWCSQCPAEIRNVTPIDASAWADRHIETTGHHVSVML